MAALLRSLFLIIGLLCVTYDAVSGDPDTTVLSTTCNPTKDTGHDAMWTLSYLLQVLVTDTPKANNYDLYNDNSGWYGHGVCSTTLSAEDCRTCMDSVRKDTSDSCPNSVGAQVQLQDCRLRYENYPFQE